MFLCPLYTHGIVTYASGVNRYTRYFNAPIIIICLFILRLSHLSTSGEQHLARLWDNVVDVEDIALVACCTRRCHDSDGLANVLLDRCPGQRVICLMINFHFLL